MGEVYPFSATEQWRVRQVALVYCWGGRFPTRDIEEANQEYGAIVHGALESLDGMTGALHHLPFGGGFMDQPVRTMEVVSITRGVFGEKIEAESQKHGNART